MMRALSRPDCAVSDIPRFWAGFYPFNRVGVNSLVGKIPSEIGMATKLRNIDIGRSHASPDSPNSFHLATSNRVPPASLDPFQQ